MAVDGISQSRSSFIVRIQVTDSEPARRRRDRQACADAQYDPLGSLYSLLEHDTASSFMDEFAEVAIDARQVIFGNARLQSREEIMIDDLPIAGSSKRKLVFLQ